MKARKHRKELLIPPAACVDPKALEILRVWAAEGGQHVTMATGLWDDPAMWGLMLVDLAKHVAAAYAHIEGRDRERVLARIREGFDAEWDDPTDRPRGQVHVDDEGNPPH